MAGKSKSAREKVKLVSTGTRKDGQATGYFYTTNKSKRNTPEKMKIMKYDPRAWNEATGRYGKHVEFKENNKWK